MSTRRVTSDSATRILDVAERLVQTRGFNAFSYADVASELGVTKASLHYHFPGKAELGTALVTRYSERFGSALDEIDTTRTTPVAKLRAYADLYAGVLDARRMCLCGILAAEYSTLPKPMRTAVVAFFDENEAWLERVLEDGRSSGGLSFEGTPREHARLVLSGLEGAMLMARTYGDEARFRLTADRLLTSLAGGPPGET